MRFESLKKDQQSNDGGAHNPFAGLKSLLNK
jgi:uncharacterized metal-binding protein YceD (DUF177 family)